MELQFQKQGEKVPHTEPTSRAAGADSPQDSSSSAGCSVRPLFNGIVNGIVQLHHGASAITSTTDDSSWPTIREPFFKRPFDILLAILGLVTSAPLWLAIAVAIKLEDGGPIFYVQERWGRGGKPFRAYKFRTMTVNADRKYGVKPANEKDHCITRVGRVLRATGMDELPQFINILKGDMSFVGPRALAVDEFVDDGNGNRKSYAEFPMFRQRQAMRPGLTSLATIYTPKYGSVRRKFRYDLLYIRRHSFWLDLRLIFLSFWISFRGKWEAKDRKL